MENEHNRSVISAACTWNLNMDSVANRTDYGRKKRKEMFKLIMEIQKQQQLLLVHMEEEDYESSDSGGERCEDKINNLFGSCKITSNVTSVFDFILNADVCMYALDGRSLRL